MADRWNNSAKSEGGPGSEHFLIVPSDADDLPNRPRAIFCQTAGTIVIRDSAGVDLSYAMTVGQILPFRPVRVLTTTTGTFYGWL